MAPPWFLVEVRGRLWRHRLILYFLHARLRLDTLVIMLAGVHKILGSWYWAVILAAIVPFIFIFVQKSLQRLSIILRRSKSVESIHIADIWRNGIIAHEIVLQFVMAASRGWANRVSLGQRIEFIFNIYNAIDAFALVSAVPHHIVFQTINIVPQGLKPIV